MKPHIERIGYLQGASPQRPIDPVRSLMEEAMAGNRMPELDPLLTCPDCNKKHDGLHGHGLLKVNKVCVDCYEARRSVGIKRGAKLRREVKRLQEGYRKILELDSMIQEIARDMLEGGGE